MHAPPSAASVAGVRAAEFVPGDVVYVNMGVFDGLCGVIQAVDPDRSELRLVISQGERRHGVTVGIDEVEHA